MSNQLIGLLAVEGYIALVAGGSLLLGRRAAHRRFRDRINAYGREV